ncbi:hypothetical protein L218DRAFT_1004382 [Marasmius fiardii PR-910]|nr:hypothetical protein L218DRAFT_1004382 [Marasmius fiardii PR-910]
MSNTQDSNERADGAPYLVQPGVGNDVEEGGNTNSSNLVNLFNFPNTFQGNPLIPMPYQQPPTNYMFMPSSHNWPFPYNHSTNHAMDIDSPSSHNSSDGEWVGHACYQLLQHIHHENKTCNDPVGHAAAVKCNNDASYITAIKLIEDDIARPH